MVLTIKHKHTIGTSYDNIHNDALLRALKEQYPQLNVKTAYSDFFVDEEGAQYTFPTNDITGYTRRSFRSLAEGRIKEIYLRINVSHKGAAAYRVLL